MIAAAHTHQVDAWRQVHILLALGIMAAYAAVPLTSLTKLPLTRPTRLMAGLFFATCAITHLAIAAGFHDSRWMLLNDAVQLVASIGFIRALGRQVTWTMRRREQLRAVDACACCGTPHRPGAPPARSRP